MAYPNDFGQQRQLYYDTVNKKPQQTATLTQEQEEDSRIGAERLSRMTNPEQTSFNLFAKPQPVQQAQPVVTPTTPVKTTPVTRNTQPQTPYGSITSMDDLAKAMGYTSPEEEERLRKASVANQRIMAVGDALRHIGNIYNTVNYAPAQKFNNPVLEEQARYERGKALRDKANYTYLNYQQQKAAQDAKQKQWEMDYNIKVADAARKAGYTEAQIKNMQDRLAQQKAYQEGQLGIGRGRLEETIRNNKERLAETKRANNARISQGNQRIKIARDNYELRKNRGSGGSGGIAPLDTPKGQITPNARNYSDQVRQLYDYAESKGYIQKGELQRKLAEMGLGNETPDAAKRQLVMNALRGNQALADYAADRLGWSYGASAPASDWDDYLDEGDDDWNDYLAD